MLIFFLLLLTQQRPPTESTDAITRRVFVEGDGFQVVRVTFAPGAAVTPPPQGYDVVIVPLDDGMSAEVDGKPVVWQRGRTILIPRGAAHPVRNGSASPVTFISVRRLADAEIKPPPLPQTSAVTLIRSEDSKYVRADTFRFERDGELQGPGDLTMGPSVFVLTADAEVRMTIASSIREAGHKPAGTVWLFKPGAAFTVANLGAGPVEIVRVSAPR